MEKRNYDLLQMICFDEKETVMPFVESSLGGILSKKFSSFDAYNIRSLIERLQNRIKDEKFLNSLLFKLSNVEKLGEFNCKPNFFEGSYVKSSSLNNLKIIISDDTVYYSNVLECHSENEGEYTNTQIGRYKKTKNGTSITYKNVIDCYKCNNTIHSRRSEISVSLYNKYGIQDFQYEEKQNQLYDIVDGKAVLRKPCVFENYKEVESYWRVSKEFILRNIKKQYAYPDIPEKGIISADNYYITHNRKPEDAKLCIAGDYIGYDSNLFVEYLQGKCNLSDIDEYVCSRGGYCRIMGEVIY